MLDEILSISIKEIAGNCSIGCTPTELWGYLDGVQLTNGRELKLSEHMKQYIHRLLLNQTCITFLPNPNYKQPTELLLLKNEDNSPQQDNSSNNSNDNNSSNNNDNNNNDYNNNDNSSNKEAPIPTIPINNSTPAQSDNEDEIIKTKPAQKLSSQNQQHQQQQQQQQQQEKQQTQPTQELQLALLDTQQQIQVIKNQLSTKTNLKKWQKEASKIDSQQQVLNLNKSYWLEPSDAFIYVADKYNQIISLGVKEEDRLTPIQFKILERVSKSRSSGFLVRDLTILFNIDSKNIFTPIKDLILKGIVVKEEVFYANPPPHISTGRLYLPKYYKKRQFNPVKEEWLPKYWFRVAFIYFLDQEKSKSLTMKEIIKKTGVSRTTVKRIKNLLVYHGFISCSQNGKSDLVIHLEKPMDDAFWEFIESDIDYAPDDDDDGDNDGDSDTAKKKPPATPTKKKAAAKATTSTKQPSAENENENEEDTYSSGASNLIMEKPINQQVFDIIRETGSVGITQKEIQEKCGSLSLKHASSIIKHLIVSFNVKIIPDLIGKQLNYKIYADPKDYITSSSTEDSSAIVPYQEYNALIEYNQNQPELEFTEGPSRMVPRTKLFVDRKNLVYNMIQESVGMPSTLIISRIRRGHHDTKFDNKSLIRILQTLLDEKKIFIIKIYTQLLTGTHKQLIFTYDARYKLEDPQVQDAIEATKSIYYNNSDSTKVKNEGIGGDDDIDQDFDELDSLNIDSNNVGTSKNPVVKPSRKQFNPTSLKYGFVKGSIVRAKLLHTFLWNFSNRHIKQQQKSQTNYSNNNNNNNNSDNQLQLVVIPQDQDDYKQPQQELFAKTPIYFNLFIKTLPVSNYLRIISQNTPIKDLSTYVKAETPIIDLPSSIKSQLFSSRSFVKRIGQLFGILKELGLIEVIVHANKLSDYYFLRHVELKNDVGETKHYDFGELENLQRYWTDLQFMSLLPREPNSRDPPEDYILNRMKYLKNIVLWGVPRIPLTPDLKNKLVSHFKSLENGDSLERDDLKTIASHYHVNFAKLSVFYLRYLRRKLNSDAGDPSTTRRTAKSKQDNKEGDQDDDDDEFDNDEDEFGAEGAYSGIFKQKRIKMGSQRRNNQSEINKAASEKRLEFKIQIAPYRRFKWTALEDSQLLKKYTEIFRDFFEKLPEGVKNSANSEFYITPSGIPSMLNPLWDKLGEGVQKIGQLCYRRMRLLVKKYPSYKNFHKSNKTPDLPLSIKEFNSLFNIQYNKSENLELFEFSRFDQTDEAIMRDKIVYLVSISEHEYSFNYGVKLLGSNKLLSRHVLESLYNDKILKSLKSRNANRSIAFCVQKIYFKNNSLNKEFFQENRVFINNIKEIPIDKVDDDDLFQFDPLTSGGSVSSMLSLFSNHKILPIISVKDSSEKEKAPKSRDFSGGRRLDLMLNKIGVCYLIREYIDYSYIENERKRAINPDVIVLNDPLESEKKAFNKIFEFGSDDEEQEEEKEEKEEDINSNSSNNKDQEDSSDDNNRSKRQKLDMDDNNSNSNNSNSNNSNSNNSNSNNSNSNNNYLSFIEKYNDQFLFEDFKSLALEKLFKVNSVYINEKSNSYIINLVLAVQEVFKVIHSSKTKGAKRTNIINHFLSNSNTEDTNSIVRNLLMEETDYPSDTDLRQFITEKLPSLILELKSIGLVETLFTFSEKKYIAKEFFQDSLLPLEYTLQLEYQQRLRYEQKYGVPEGKEPLSKKYESPLNYRQKRLIKPWIEPNGTINRSNFNKVFNEFITNVYHYPGSTLETIAHRLQKYSPSLLKEVAIILQQLDYLTIMEYDYKPPSLFSSSEFITKPFNPLNDGCTQLIFNSTPKFFNLQSDFSVYLLTEDF